MNTRATTWGRRAVGALGVVVMKTTVSGCGSYQKVDDAHIGIHYTDGWLEGQQFERVLEPGDTQYVYNDHVYMLPTRQITWMMSDRNGDAPALEITAKDGETMRMGLTVRAFLNTRPPGDGPIESFFNEICNKDRTLTREDEDNKTIEGCWEGASDEGLAGWILMLDDALGDPAVAVANNVASGYDAEQLRYNADTKAEFEADFAAAFRAQQGRMVGNSGYFCGPGYVRAENDKEADGWCPNLAVQITGIVYDDPDLEAIPSQKQLSIEREDLALQEEQTALAEQRAQNARSTPQNLALMEAEARLECAKREGCTMVIVSSGAAAPNVNVTAGG